MTDLNATLVQFDIQWHQPGVNRRRIDELLERKMVSPTDLIVLPEMFSTGFTMASAELAESMEGPTIEWMADLARRFDAVVTGTLPIHHDGHYYNRLIWQRPDGSLGYYDKRHLFSMADEHTAYSAGRARPIFSVKGWNIRPIICYDLRFPVWCRVQRNDYDALLCPANWPDPRHNAWLTLLTARAIENQSYVIANNRVGVDSNGKRYLGDSRVIDAKGNLLCDSGSVEDVVSATLSKHDLERFRTKFPLHADADAFELR